MLSILVEKVSDYGTKHYLNGPVLYVPCDDFVYSNAEISS